LEEGGFDWLIVGGGDICPKEVRAATSKAEATPRIDVLAEVSTYMTA